MFISSPALERIAVTVPDPAMEAYEAAFSTVCESVSFFRDDTTGYWQIEGIRRIGSGETELAAALALAASLAGTNAEPTREPLAPQDWLARSYAGFPEQRVGRRFAVRGSHIEGPPAPGRITLLLDAGLAFGSGEHGSTRGCLLALERVARRRPRRLLDLGTGSGILAIAAARLLHRPVLATDIDPWSVRLCRRNAAANGTAHLVRVRQADGWTGPVLRRNAPYDLVLANILARPLARMAKQATPHLRRGGTIILSGLLQDQARGVLASYRRLGLSLWFQVDQPPWTTLVMRARAGTASPSSPILPHPPVLAGLVPGTHVLLPQSQGQSRP